MKKILLALLFAPISLLSQSLGKERAQRIKESVVRILVDTSRAQSGKYVGVGTGFMVMEEGYLATCYHVIESSFIRSRQGRISAFMKIAVEFYTGEIVDSEISNYCLTNGNNEAVSYDYCLLALKTKPKTKYSILKIGTFQSVEEGEEVYSCGFPLGIKQPVFSKGLFSTKWIQQINVNLGKGRTLVQRDVAWLDLTMNRGNSGGPILKFGKSFEDDRVVGIATFILNPYANEADRIGQILQNPPGDVKGRGFSMMYTNKLILDAVASNSIGVSGCVSIDYLAPLLNK